jgi:hypothetical protein
MIYLYIVRTFVKITMYPYTAQQYKRSELKIFLKSQMYKIIAGQSRYFIKWTEQIYLSSQFSR